MRIGLNYTRTGAMFNDLEPRAIRFVDYILCEKKVMIQLTQRKKNIYNKTIVIK